MPQYNDITDWNPQPWVSTGGTRDKKYLQSPDGKFYFFKKSAHNYPLEFWSEIIAYELGTQLGLNILRYDVAFTGSEIGCISQSMIDQDKEELKEGGKYLQAFDSAFNPDDKKQRNQYTFQLIENALNEPEMGGYIEEIIKIIVFDSIIGNSDRHQDNWALIEEIDFMELKRISESLAKIKIEQGELVKNIEAIGDLLSQSIVKLRFAPIYDNGSSLCRELTPGKVSSMLRNNEELDGYLRRGDSEIHWEGHKVSHFELIKQLAGTAYSGKVSKIIKSFSLKFDPVAFKSILEQIDKELPVEYGNVKLPENRKELILKLITLRFRRLSEFIQ